MLTLTTFLSRLSSAKAQEPAQGDAGRPRRDSPSGTSAGEEHSGPQTGTISSASTWTPAAGSGAFPIMNRQTFELIHDRMRDDVLLIFARDDNDVPIAGALNLIGSETLYGRYWGRSEERPFLHFEVCYYQAIDYAIKHSLKRVEAGAQGGHKLARGYAPSTTYSAHWIGHEGLRHAVEQYLEQERPAVAREIEYLSTRQPFRKSED